MAGEVSPVGQGFFTQSGQLKSKDQLKKEEIESAKRVDESSVDSTSSVSPQTIKGALNTSKSKFLEQAGEIISTVNEQEAALKEAAQLTKKQLATAKELKTALKEGDQKTIEKKQDELRKLIDKGKEVEEKVEEINKRTSPDRAKALSFGNEQLGIVKTDRLKFESSGEDADLNSVKGVNNLIDEIKSSRDEISSQLSKVREVRRDVKATVRSVDEKVRSIEEDSIREFDEARTRTDKVAQEITSAGAQGALVSNIRESVVASLLAG